MFDDLCSDSFSFTGDSISSTGSTLERSFEASPLFCDVNLSDFLATLTVCDAGLSLILNISVLVLSLNVSLLGVK